MDHVRAQELDSMMVLHLRCLCARTSRLDLGSSWLQLCPKQLDDASVTSDYRSRERYDPPMQGGLGVGIEKRVVQEHKYVQYDETVFAMITQNTLVHQTRQNCLYGSVFLRSLSEPAEARVGAQGERLHDARTELGSSVGRALSACRTRVCRSSRTGGNPADG